MAIIYVQPPEHVPSAEFVEKNKTRHYSNSMRVSETSYPSYFPPEQTYVLGNETIIGLGHLTMPVSQDTYGFYSLVIFCTDGIYTLGVNRVGDGAYTNVTYASPEICLSRKTICEIGGAIFFASDKGLIAFTSQDTGKLYADHLNGEICMKPDLSPDGKKDGAAVYAKIIDSPAVVSVTNGTFRSALSYTDFVNYLKGSNTWVRYVSNKNKLVVYNKGYDYVYFIDIPTGNTTKLNHRIFFDNGDFPDTVFWTMINSTGNNMLKKKTFGYLSEGSVNIPCLIQSRPIVIQADDKNSFRLVMTGKFASGNANDWAELVILASLDAEHWRVIGVKEKKLKDGFHNLGCVTGRESWKYLMFIFAGRLVKGSHIDSIDLTVQGRYNNKKR